jgi:hypothetical protein
LPKDVWDSNNDSNDIFLSSAYLSALEQAPPENMEFRYAIISKDTTPVGIGYFQIVKLNHRLHRPPMELLRRKEKSLIHDIHDRIADTATFRLLICGNAMLSGEHGFSMAKISQDTALHVIVEIAYALRISSPHHISVTLIKDFYKRQGLPTNILSQFGYHSFDAGPNMVVPIRKDWTTFDNYLSGMKPKYRKRAASAIKKGSAIHCQSMSLENIIKNKDELFVLYCQVVGKVGFKIFFLSPNYFIELKRRLGEKFICEGYFLNSKMVGFTTRIFNEAVIEGYSHGIDFEHNKEFELYQNFLLNDIKTAISTQSAYVNTGRTSVAMKSSVGAIPNEMSCYMRFSGGHFNQLLKPLLFFIKPSYEYCRNPFVE